MNKILIISNDSDYTYKFRKEIIIELLKNNYNVTVITNFSDNVENIEKLGITLIESKIDRRGFNPFRDLHLLLFYKKQIKFINPDIVLTYTIKPNIYGGLISRFYKIPYIPNITGLGTAVEEKGILQFITISLYKIALKKSKMIFFQNQENKDFMLSKNIIKKNFKLIPGSGVNINHFNYIKYPSDKDLHFLFVGRVMKSKGIDHYLEAASIIKHKYPETIFHVLGSYEEDYKKTIEKYESKGYIIYHGRVDDVRKYHKLAHAIIHPTFHEGMSNVLLEAAASGRAVLASTIPGCIETFDEGVSGLGFECRNTLDLVSKIENFIKLSHEEKKEMGIKGRRKVLREFDRTFVINAYLEEIKKIVEGK
jgi:glycosyltransferase involved in cell wall biosynthesis